MTRWLEQHGLLNLFTVLCTRDDVRRVKPDPELYVLAAQRLGLRAGDCLAVEDSLNGGWPLWPLECGWWSCPTT